MTLRKIFVYAMVLVALSTVPFLLPAQTEQSMPFPEEKFVFSYDYAVFRTQQNKTLLEIYYSVFRNYLKFVPEDSLFKAVFVFKAEIWQEDSLVARNLWKNINRADSLSQIEANQKLYGVGFFVLAPGEYQ